MNKIQELGANENLDEIVIGKDGIHLFQWGRPRDRDQTQKGEARNATEIVRRVFFALETLQNVKVSEPTGTHQHRIPITITFGIASPPQSTDDSVHIKPKFMGIPSNEGSRTAESDMMEASESLVRTDGVDPEDSSTFPLALVFKDLSLHTDLQLRLVFRRQGSGIHNPCNY